MDEIIRGNLNYPPKISPKVYKLQNPEIIHHDNHRKKFPNYFDVAYVTPRTRMLCEIISQNPNSDIESALNSTGITPSSELVEEVLKLSYNSPEAAVGFFRWVGFSTKVSSYAWNLMVDLLGKNEMFEQMWGAVRKMKEEGLVSIATFVSVFESYCTVGNFDDAFMTFDVMEKYGVDPDVVAVNSLLSAICREERQIERAYEFFDRVKVRILPDSDTYAILLEGCEREGNIAKARITFGEMVAQVGWNLENMAAYNAFLNTLLCNSEVDEAIKLLHVMRRKGCLPGLKFFSNALDVLVKQRVFVHVAPLWDMMVGNGILPNLTAFNAMIGMLCYKSDIESVFRFLDEMPFYGVFPDSLTYNMIFECLVHNKKAREVSWVFREMTKNECPPTPGNCAAAVDMLFDQDDPETGLEIWDYLVENREIPIDETANALLIGLCKVRRFSSLKKFAYDMLDEKIVIQESTMRKLQRALFKEGRNTRDIYDDLERRWKALHVL